MMRCGWMLHCGATAIGVAAHPSGRVSPRAVCFGHQHDAQADGWQLRSFAASRPTNDLICWCDLPVTDPVGGCGLCGKLIVTREKVDGFKRRGFMEAYRLGELILVEQERRRLKRDAVDERVPA